MGALNFKQYRGDEFRRPFAFKSKSSAVKAELGLNATRGGISKAAIFTILYCFPEAGY